MSRNYGALRLWATVLVIVGIVGLVSVAIGAIMAVYTGCEHRTRSSDPPVRRPTRCAVRYLADRDGAVLDSSRRRRRVRPRSAERCSVR